MYRILTINPGSTSSKIAIFDDEQKVFVKTLLHSAEDLAKFPDIASQFDYRKKIVVEELVNAGYPLESINAIVGRGGLVKPIESGVYEVNDAIIRDLQHPTSEHASNLGGLIAYDIAKSLNGVKAYIADPVVVDELCPLARVSGHPEIERVSIFHALNQKAIARTFAKECSKRYEDLNLILVHLGGGVSVSAHKCGRVIDTNNALDGDGPFSPERSGSLPTASLVKLCFDGKHSEKIINKMIKGAGGVVAYLGTNDFRTVEDMYYKDEKFKFISDAMCYQIAKEIGAMAAVLKGKVDAIILTGGIAYNKIVCNYITEMVEFIAPVKVYPGEDELRALALNGLMVLRGEIQPKVYK